mgnify:CR=1
MLSGMDLLEQYKKQYPETFKQKPQWQPSDEYGFFIRLVMRLSRGRVRDTRQAARVLLIAAAVILLLSLFFFVGVPGFGPETKPLAPGAHPDLER